MRYGIALSLFLLALPVTASDLVNSVPTRFLGSWSSSPDACGTGTDDLVLELKPDRISHWESSGPLKSIVLHGQDEIALIAELSDEGHTWLTAAVFRLSPEGDKLIDATSGDEVVRYRCPDSSK